MAYQFCFHGGLETVQYSFFLLGHVPFPFFFRFMRSCPRFAHSPAPRTFFLESGALPSDNAGRCTAPGACQKGFRAPTRIRDPLCPVHTGTRMGTDKDGL